MRAVMNEMPPHWVEEWKSSEASQWDEMWEGVLHVPPMPIVKHQDFETALVTYLRYVWARPKGWKAFQQINLSPPGEPDWRQNYRVPDILLLDPERFGIDRGSHFAGAPLVVVEIRSPNDETCEKFPFYSQLGVPEVWVFDRDTRGAEVYALAAGPKYQQRSTDADGWLRSPATGIELRPARSDKVKIRVGGVEGTTEELPEY